jgi:transcriptional regulator with XRE-family HTH domain
MRLNKITQVDLAKKLNVTQASISRYLSGSMQMDIDTLEKIASIFEVTIDYLMGNTLSKKLDVKKAAFSSLSTEGLSDDEIILLKNMIEQFKKNKNIK